MRRLPLVLVALALVALASTSCARKPAPASANPRVVATIFPLYDFARTIAGERFEVVQLLPPGVEAHGYEPKPSDLASIAKAALFVYTNDPMEPWAADLARSASSGGKLRILAASAGIELMEGHHDEEGEVAGEEHGEEESDPHVWLDPSLAAVLARNLGAELAALDPEGAEGILARSAELETRLLDLDRRIAEGLKGARSRTIVYGGHFAFGYFARRYGLDYVSPYAGFSPNAEPSPAAVAELSKVLKASGTGVIFYEELVEPRVARVIAAETGARLELLHGAHAVGAEELAAGASYIGIMEANLAKLRLALGAP